MTESSNEDERIAVTRNTPEGSSDVKIAKWEEDNVWYRAIILSVCGAQTKVKFTDYGNEDFVNCIVDCLDAIPPGDLIDPYVIDPDGEANSANGQVKKTN